MRRRCLSKPSASSCCRVRFDAGCPSFGPARLTHLDEWQVIGSAARALRSTTRLTNPFIERTRNVGDIGALRQGLQRRCVPLMSNGNASKTPTSAIMSKTASPRELAAIAALAGPKRYWVSAARGAGNKALPVWPHEPYASQCAVAQWEGSAPTAVEVHKSWTPSSRIWLRSQRK